MLGKQVVVCMTQIIERLCVIVKKAVTTYFTSILYFINKPMLIPHLQSIENKTIIYLSAKRTPQGRTKPYKYTEFTRYIWSEWGDCWPRHL